MASQLHMTSQQPPTWAPLLTVTSQLGAWFSKNLALKPLSSQGIATGEVSSPPHYTVITSAVCVIQGHYPPETSQ